MCNTYENNPFYAILSRLFAQLSISCSSGIMAFWTAFKIVNKNCARQIQGPILYNGLSVHIFTKNIEDLEILKLYISQLLEIVFDLILFFIELRSLSEYWVAHTEKILFL